MALVTSLESVGERREQWRRLEKHWRDYLEEANGNGDHTFFEIETMEELKDSLREFRTNDTIYGQEGRIDVVERLAPTFRHLEPFVRTISIASQYQPVGALLWAGVLSVLQAASKQHQIIPTEVVDLMNELSKSITGLTQDKSEVYRFTAVQYTLQDLFEDYIGYCVQACTYFSRPSHEHMLANVFSRGPRGMLEAAKSRISRHVRKLGDAVVREIQLHRTRQESEIAKLVPSGISDMPQDINVAPSEAKIEFPVHTINRARNSAFVGRDDLLDEIADKFSKSMQSHQQSSIPTGMSQRNLRSSTASTWRQERSSSHIPIAPTARGMAHREDLSERESSRSQTTSNPAAASSNPLRAVPIICVLHGLGGVGKTQVALEYYYEHRGDYDACFWMEAEHDWTLASSFARIADKLGLIPQKTTDDGGHEVQNKAIEESRNWLQATEHKWLAIFDNVEDFGDLARYMPTESRSDSAIIITTQSPTIPAWFENVRIIQVKTLDPDTAAVCVFKYLDRDQKDEEERELACQLAEHVGCSPLAMATIGGYVKQSQMSLAEFFENIKRKATLWEKAPKVQDTQAYERSLITVFSKAFEDLTPPARELLNIIAFLDPDSIPEEMFTKAIEKKLFKHINSKNDLLDCYFELRSRQLIRRDTSSGHPYISIHRIVQWNVLLDLSVDYDERWRVFKQAFGIVEMMLPKTSPLQIPEPEVWPPYARHGRQILELRTHCLWPEPPVELPLDFAQILTEMGTYMWFSGKFPEGEKALGTAEDILDDNKAKFNDPIRANIYLMLGIITSFEGVSERRRSMEFRKNGYHSRNAGLGQKPKSERTSEDEILLMNVHSDMAFGYIQEEDFESTAKYMEECLEEYKKWEEDEMVIPFEYSKYYQLMAHCLMADQKPLEAIQAITRCHELMQKAAGNDHPMAQLIKFCHANLLWHSGGKVMRQKALDIHKAVLEFRRRIIGEFSHFTLESYSTCGKLCHDAGEDEEARRYLETCLQRRKRTIWNEEGVTRAQFRLARVLRSLADKALKDGNKQTAQAYTEGAERKEKEVAKIIRRYRKDYEKYMPLSEDKEENLDQMVSFWAGRFTGGLKQKEMDLSILEDTENNSHHRPAKRMRTE